MSCYGRLLVNGDEAQRVRSIFELCLDRQSLIETAKELDERGWATKRWVTKKGNKRYRYYVCQNAQSRGWHTCPSPSVPISPSCPCLHEYHGWRKSEYSGSENLFSGPLEPLLTARQ